MKRRLRRLYHAAWGAAVALAAVAERLSGRRADPREVPPVRRILVLRFGLLGDGTALLSPALQRLKELFPASVVHVLATPLQGPLLQGLPFVDAVIPWTAGDLLEPRQALRPGAWRAAAGAVAELRRGRYDLALACYGPLASAVALLSGAPRRLGYAAEAFPLALTIPLPGGRYDRGWHEVDYNVALADAAARDVQSSVPGKRPDGTGRGSSEPQGGPLRLVVEEGAQRTIAALLQPQVAPGVPLVVLVPGATNGRAKRWPLPYWVTLAGQLLAGGRAVVLAGGPEERSLGRAIRAQAGDAVADLVGRTTLPELLALLERASVVVSGDSGPLHLAIAVGRPVVAIYGPTDPRQSGPYRAARATLVRHELPCSPCYRLDRVADCPLGHTLCQRLVTPQRVYHAVEDLLDRHRGMNSPAGGGQGLEGEGLYRTT